MNDDEWKDMDALTAREKEIALESFSAEQLTTIPDYEFMPVGDHKVWRRLKKPLPPGVSIAHVAPTAPAPLADADRIQNLPLGRLHPSPTQPRRKFSEEKHLEMTESVRAQGIIQPLLARQREDGSGDFEIVAGERRWRAACALNLATAPVIVRELGDSQVLEMQLIENLQRVDLDAVEEANQLEAMLALRDEKQEPLWTPEKLGARIGKTARHIAHRLDLLLLPSSAQKAVQSGEMSEFVARSVAAIPSAELRKKAAKEVMKGHGEGPMSRAEAMNHLRANFMVQLRGAVFNQKDGKLVPARFEGEKRVFGGACTDCPFNTANRAEESVHHHLCLLPTCYSAKVAAAVRSVKDAALAKGAIVVEGEHGRALIYPDGTPKAESGMVNLSHEPTAELVGNREAKSWAKMISEPATGEIVVDRDEGGGAIKGTVSAPIEIRETVVIDDKGKAHHLVERQVAIEAAIKCGHGDLFTAKSSRAKPLAAANDSAAKVDAADKLEKKIGQALSLAAMEELVVAISKDDMGGPLFTALLETAIFHSASDALAFVCYRRKIEGDDRPKAIRDYADTLEEVRIPALVIELLLAGWVRANGVQAAGFKALAKVYGLDLAAIKARVTAELSEKKPKPKKKPKADERPVRERIAELAAEKGISEAELQEHAQRLISKPLATALGSELTIMLEAIRGMKAVAA